MVKHKERQGFTEVVLTFEEINFYKNLLAKILIPSEEKKKPKDRGIKDDKSWKTMTKTDKKNKINDNQTWMIFVTVAFN